MAMVWFLSWHVKMKTSYMKKILLFLAAMLILPSVSFAQQSMTDEQIISFITTENEKGTSREQIVTKLIQRGVDVYDVRRAVNKYERQQKDGTLGATDDGNQGNNRLRKQRGSKTSTQRNGARVGADTRSDDQAASRSNYRLKSNETRRGTAVEFDDEYLEMDAALGDFLPIDSIAWLEQLLEEKEMNKKRVFGRDIFNNKELTFEPAMNIATPQNYVLGPGDEVNIDIYGASQKSVQATVTPDGDIIIDGFGPIAVSGLTVEQANNRLRSRIGGRYSSSSIKLTLGQSRTITVNVMGEVKTPGTFTLSAFASVFHALYNAGGTNDLGTLRNIQVFRGGKLVSKVDIYDYILNGRQSGNVRLSDGDVIVVGPYDCIVNIGGRVKRPMYYEMRTDESLATLLKYSGGFTGDAYTKAMRVIRKTGRERSVFNVGEFDWNTFRVVDGDSVLIDSILPRYENMVELKGAVFRPGMYQVGGAINSVRSLLESADGVTEDAITAHAVMHRMKPDRTLEVISVDVDGIMNGTVADIPMKPNDVLFIPTRTDIMEERTITIHGEVQYPGVYKYADNETLEDFVLQAGGLKETASTVKVDVARRLTNPKAMSSDSLRAQTFTFALKDGFVIDGEQGFILQPFDEVYVRKSPGSNELQNVAIEGEVMFGGNYTLSNRQPRLSDLVRAAGGVSDLAYVPGARLMRKTNATERERMEAILKKERIDQDANLREALMRAGNASAVAQVAGGKTISTSQTQVFEIPAFYPVGIELDKALANPGGPEDIVIREGDRLVVPQYNGTVKINGEVMYPNTVPYVKGKPASYYINQAGGYSARAKKRNAYIIHQNGFVEKVNHWSKPMPGSEIVVPAKAVSTTTLSERLSIATSVGSFAAIIATIANILKK